MRKIMLVAVFCVLGFALLGQAQGHLFLRIEHGDVALEIGGTEAGSFYYGSDVDVCIALFSSHLGEYIHEHWSLSSEWGDLADFRNLRDSLSQYLAASNKVFTCIYPSDLYHPEYFQVLGLGDSVLVRGTNEGHFIAMKLSLDEARKVADALSTALTLAEKP